MTLMLLFYVMALLLQIYICNNLDVTNLGNGLAATILSHAAINKYM